MGQTSGSLDKIQGTAGLKSKRNLSFINLLLRDMLRERWMYVMMFPGLVYFLLFKYLPMAGLVMAFQDYKPYLGFLHSRWVGFHQFQEFFSTQDFWQLFSNTMILAVLNLVFHFPLPIILALLLNELTKERFKRMVQSLVYVPHFVSWVVLVGISYIMLNVDDGVVNQLIRLAGGEPVQFLTSSAWFRPIYLIQAIWKDVGWSTIIFLAALAGVDPQLYESAIVDGAGRWRQLWNITLPSIRNVIVILLILRLGHFLDNGFHHIFLMMNSLNREVADVFDTYVYEKGLTQAQYSYSAAVGVFKSVVGLILVLGSNWLAKKFGEEGIY